MNAGLDVGFWISFGSLLDLFKIIMNIVSLDTAIQIYVVSENFQQQSKSKRKLSSKLCRRQKRSIIESTMICHQIMCHILLLNLQIP